MATLVQQCLAYESSFRPTGLEVVDWIEDLHSEMPDDTTPRPPMKNVAFSFQEDSAETPSTPRGAIAREASQDTETKASTSIFSGLLPRKTSPNRHRLVSMEKDSVRMVELIYKRNTHGFRLWKKLLVTVQKTCLSWTNSAGQTKLLKLRGATFQITGPTRFHITYPGETVGDRAESAKQTKEFAVQVASKLVLWKRAIEEVCTLFTLINNLELSAMIYLLTFYFVWPLCFRQ